MRRYLPRQMKKLSLEQIQEAKNLGEVYRLQSRISQGWQDYQVKRRNPSQEWVFLTDRDNLLWLDRAIANLINLGTFDGCTLKGFKSSKICGIRAISLV